MTDPKNEIPGRPTSLAVLFATVALMACRPGPTGDDAPPDTKGSPMRHAAALKAPLVPAPSVPQAGPPALPGVPTAALPIVDIARPGVVRLAAPGHGVTLLFGSHLDRVDRVRVVTAAGAPAPGIDARLVVEPGRPCEPLVVELSAGEGVSAGHYLLQLNTGAGGIYLPAELAQIEVVADRRPPKRKEIES